MSGPIVRKYGFPNFEKIFGERELKHGGEGPGESPAAGKPEGGPPGPSSPPAPESKPATGPKNP